MKEELDYLRPRLMEIFTYLHANPEISWHEVETTNYIVELLTQEGFLLDDLKIPQDYMLM